MVILTVLKTRTQNVIKRTSYNFKIPAEKYEEIKKRQTRVALHQLKNSEQYKKYLEDKAAGRIPDIVLSDNDQIDLSDDQVSANPVPEGQ